MSELPDGWVEAPLGALGSWFGGGTPSKSKSEYWNQGTIPWVSPKDMKRPFIDSAEDSITELAVEQSSTKLIPKDSVLMVVRSGILAHTFPVATSTVPVTLNQDMKALHPSGVPVSFLAHGLRAFGPKILDECTKQGTTVASVNTDSLQGFNFPLPPLNEQKRIVAKIDALTEKSREARQALDEVPALLDQLRQSILAAAFRGDLTKKWREQNPNVEPASVLLERIRKERRRKWEEAELAKFKSKGKVPKNDDWKSKYVEPEPVDTEGLPELPEGWCWASLAEVTSTHDGVRVPLKAADRAKRSGRYSYYGASGVIDAIDDFLFDGKYLLLAEDGANLLSRSTPIAFIAEGRFWVNNHAHVVQTNVMKEEYLMHYLNGRDISPWVSGTAQPKLNQKNMDRIPVPLCAHGEMSELLRRVSDLFVASQTLREALHGEKDSLAQLDASILAKAFRGELVPQDPNDEPASVLLERIRKEREGAGTVKKSRRKTNS
jgi:type I restriction enzyme S subunit